MAEIQRVDRNIVKQGKSYTLKILGLETNFSENSQVSISGTQVLVNRMIFHSSEWIDAEIEVKSDAATGYRNLTVTTGLEVVTKTSALQVVASNASVIDEVIPSAVLKNSTVVLKIVGDNTWFYGTTPQITPSDGITIKEIEINSPIECFVTIEISGGAELGFRDINMVR